MAIFDRLGLRLEPADFRKALGLAVAHWRDYVDPASRSEFLACLEEANYIFAGPGSPSFALRCWRGTEVPSILRRCLRSGGCLVFASAAALTLGAFTIPVYEIFKVGEELHWLPGMNLLSEVGFRVVVVPHFDSGSGNDFDTRFCYLGERRFLRMTELLPPDVTVLGVDEHRQAHGGSRSPSSRTNSRSRRQYL